jgi:hypothetical protein
MHTEPKRINITLDAAQASKLARMAERAHLQEGTLARSLLSVAIDAADPEESHVHTLLSAIPGALERAQAGSRELRAGKGIPIEDV